MGDFDALAANIQFSFCKHQVPLLQIDKNLWNLTYTFNFDPFQQRVCYSYNILTKGSTASRIPFVGRLFSGEPIEHREAGKRYMYGEKSLVYHDVFHCEGDKSYYSETVPKSILFYINWLLQFVNRTNIAKIIGHVGRMKFRSCDTKYVKLCLAWILVQAVSFVNDVQRLYLCIILGHLASNYLSRALPLPNDSKTKIACDHLLQCLQACAVTELLSLPNLEPLETIAAIVVENCSSPGWLTFAAHFYPYLGVNHVVRTIITSEKCDQKEFRKMVNFLLSHLKMDHHEELVHKKLLKKVLEAAPDQDAVLELFENPGLDLFFSSDEDRVDFFVNFYQDSHRVERQVCGKNANPGKRLLELVKIPEKLLDKMHRLVLSSLLEFAKSTDELKDKHVEAFCRLIVSKQHSKYTLSTDQVSTVLLELSKSRSMPHHSLLLRLLSNKDFDSDWHKMSLCQKVNTCSSWVVTKVIHVTKGPLENAGRTTIVYEAVEELMSCSLNACNKNLAVEVCRHAIEKLFKNEVTSSILKAHKNIEKLSPVIQECYIDHVKDTLEREPHLIRNSSKILMQYPHSR